MEPALPVPKEPQGDVIGSDYAGLRDAADEVATRREQQGPPVEPDRTYREVSTGEPKPENETVSIEQASWDLTGARIREQTIADLTE